MQVANIECQIAQAQLRRYLTGEEMPNSIVNDLETHLRHCPDCMAAAQTLRESLKGVLQAKITGKPVPSVELPKATLRASVTEVREDEAPAKAVVQAPADILDAPDSQFKPKRTVSKSQVRTLLYSSALAAILILMSTVFKDPTKLFGPRASSVKTDTPPAIESPNTETVPAETPTNEVEVGSPPVAETNTVEAPKVEPNTADAKPLQTDGLIVADSQTGTTTVKTAAPKQDPKPEPKTQPKTQPKKKTSGSKPGTGTIKVYPPDK